MSISENIMNAYEHAIKKGDHKCRKITKDVLVYLSSRTKKDFCELSDEEISKYLNELLTSEVTCGEWSGIDECKDKNYTDCKALYECFTEA
jgi:hypothetical protein